MRIEVKESPHPLVLFWISREEGADKEFMELLKPQFRAWKSKKYQPILFESGAGNQEDSMYLLMKRNYEILAKRQFVSDE